MLPPSAPVRRTFLFTDIESSTRLWDQFPDAMLQALDTHDSLLRTAIDAAGGRVVHHTGDGLVSVFSSAAAAVDAALAAQRALAVAEWPGLDEVKVRMGVHSGDVLQRNDEYHGWALNVASRLHQLAHGGQIVLSGAAQAEAERGMREPVDFLDLGLHRLRDVAEPLRVYTVLAAGLPEQFGDLRGSVRPVPSLPRALTTFVGRGAEVQHVSEQLLSHRFVTLAGVAGVGKTRLAVEVATAVSGRFAEGVAMCELAGVAAPQVGVALATALGVERRTLRNAEESVLEWLHDKELLLILDNCEDATEAVGDLALAVSRHAPRCRLLATSREPLRVDGEHVTLLQPFGVDGDVDDGIELFLERARSAGAQLDDDARTRAVIADVCQAVAGVPLAIEIAASNAASLALLDIVDAVRAGELPGAGRTGGGRHRSVHDALDLTFERLEPSLRAAFLSCSVFPATFDRTAFAAVAAPDAGTGDVLSMLRGLVDRSLVVSESRRERTRFRLLEPVRLYAESHLDPSARAELQAAFVHHYVGLAEDAADRLRGPEEARWVVQLDLDFDNLRAAHGRAIDSGNADDALRIVAALWDYAFMRMRSEIFDWGEAAAAAAPTDHPGRPFVLGVVALGSWTRESPLKATAFAEESLRLEAELGVAKGLPVRLALLNSAEYGGAAIDVRGLMSDVMALSIQSGNPYWTTNVDVVRSLGHSFGGRGSAALDLANRALGAARESGNPSAIAWALFGRGVATELIDTEHAETILDDSLERARAVDNRWIEAMCSTRLASLRRRRGSVLDAMTMVLELLDTWERAGHRSHVWSAVRQAALCLADAGDDAHAVTLNQAATAARLALPQLPADAADLASALEAIGQRAGDEQVQRWAARADLLDQAEAVRLARQRLAAAIDSVTATAAAGLRR